MLNRRQWLTGIGATALPSLSRAQDSWPSRPVSLIVPFPAGGGTDAFARPLASEFNKLAAHPMHIENHAGGGGTVGAALAAKAAADGHTLFMGGVHHAIAPSIHPNLSYDLQRDFEPLLLVARVPQVIVVHPGRVQARSTQELIALAKRAGKPLSYVTAGHGTSHHLAGELFQQQTGVTLHAVHHRGAGPALQALLAGEADLMFDGLGSSSAHIKAGRLLPLMLAAGRRNPGFPGIASAKEAGLPDYDVSTWYGIWAPKGTPEPARAAAIAQLRQACRAPANQTLWNAQGAEFADLQSEAFGFFALLETRKWAKVVKAAGKQLASAKPA